MSARTSFISDLSRLFSLRFSMFALTSFISDLSRLFSLIFSMSALTSFISDLSLLFSLRLSIFDLTSFTVVSLAISFISLYISSSVAFADNDEMLKESKEFSNNIFFIVIPFYFNINSNNKYVIDDLREYRLEA